MDITKRLSLLKPLRMACGQFLACCLVVFIRALYVHGSDLWNDQHVVNFAAAWIPGIVSVIIGILPEKDWAKMRVHHRFLIVFVGITWSSLLWHQQTLNEKSASAAQNKIVNDAVSEANQHSDQKFKEVKTDVGIVDSKVMGVGKSLAETKQSLSTQVQKTSDRLDLSIGKVGKPEPPEHAKLQFSLFRDGMQEAEYPLTSESLPRDTDGNINVKVAVRNTSGVQAEQVELWVEVCSLCLFATEPNGFDKPKGIDDRIRHKVIPAINPGVTVADNDVNIKVVQPNVGRMGVAMRATCKNCQRVERSTDFFITLEPKLDTP